jgi:hypothetical protein
LTFSPEPFVSEYDKSDQMFLSYSYFLFLRPSTMEGRLPWDAVFISSFHNIWLSFNFGEYQTSGWSDIPSIRGRLHIKNIWEHLAWSPKPKFQIWRRSDRWLLRYSTFCLPIYLLLVARHTHRQTDTHNSECRSTCIH